MSNRLSKAAVELRRRLRLNQKRLAEEIGVTDQAISNWICGRARPEPESMAAIESALGIPMRDWVESSEESGHDVSATASSGPHAKAG